MRYSKVLKGITDDERKLLDEFEDVEYDRKAVEVVLTDTSEKLQVGCGNICMEVSFKVLIVRPLASLSFEIRLVENGSRKVFKETET
ncbi:hypothetical protein YC2023_103159 [Brassica napus]